MPDFDLGALRRVIPIRFHQSVIYNLKFDILI